MADGHRHDCKVCNLAARKAKYIENPAPYIARVKRWQQENSDRVNEYRREYRRRPDRQRADRDGHLRRKYGISSRATRGCLKLTAACVRSVVNLGQRIERFTLTMTTNRAGFAACSASVVTTPSATYARTTTCSTARLIISIGMMHLLVWPALG